MLVIGDRSTFRFAGVLVGVPCVFLIVVGTVLAVSSRLGAGLLLVAIGLGGLAVLLPFFLRLCCLASDDRFMSFASFLPARLPTRTLRAIESEPFGSGSRVVAVQWDGAVRPLFMTPQPPWVSDAYHDGQVALAVERLRSALPAER